MSTVLVTGANGFVGSHIVPALVDAGHHVLALVRDEDGAAQVLRRLARRAARVGRDPARRRHEARHAPRRPRRRRRGPPPGRRPARLGRRRHAPPGQHGGHPQHPAGRDRTPASAASSTSARSASSTTRPPLRAAPRSKAHGPRARERPRLDDPHRRRSCSGRATASSTSWPAWCGCRPGIVPITGKGDARFQPLAIADLARAAVQALADDATVGREYPLGGPRYWTYREIVEEVLRGMGKRRAARPDAGRPDPPRGRGVGETVRLPFPVATDQLRQLKHDNIGPARRRPDRLRVRAAADGGRTDAPAPEAEGPGARHAT